MSAAFTGTAQVLRVVARRDRILGPVVAAFLVLLVLGTAVQYAGLFPTDAARAAFAAQVRDNAALTAFTGQLHGTGLGNLVLWKVGDIAFTLTGLVMLLLVVRHTRSEEESGRAELVAAGAVGRFAPLTAALAEVAVLGLVVACGTAAGLAALGMPVAGSVVFALALVAPGWVSAAAAVLAAQLADRARTAVSLAASVLAVGYLLRFVADGSGSTALLWVSPNGWSHLVEPFARDRAAVLLLPLVVVALLVAAAYRVAALRDVGSGLLHTRPGPAAAAPSLRGPWSLARRLHRGPLLGWTAGFVVFSAATATVAAGMDEVADRSGPQVQEFFQRYAGSAGASTADTFLWLILLSAGSVATLYPLLVALRLRSEESSGRAELTLATAVSRTSWAGGHITVALAGSAWLLVVAGLAAGVAHGLSTGDLAGQLPRVLAAALVQIPAVWVVGAVGILAVGAFPRLATVATWAVFLFVNLFGEALGPILGLDYGIANQAVPFHHVPKLLTGGRFPMTPLLTMLVVACGLAGAGLLALRRRDLA